MKIVMMQESEKIMYRSLRTPRQKMMTDFQYRLYKNEKMELN